MEKKCPNCQETLKSTDKFCPSCGQKQDELLKPFKTLFSDFFESIFNFDGKIWKTILHLLFYPGKMSVYYIEGKRASYMPPIRLFLFCNLFYFIGLQSITIENLNINEDALVHKVSIFNTIADTSIINNQNFKSFSEFKLRKVPINQAKFSGYSKKIKESAKKWLEKHNNEKLYLHKTKKSEEENQEKEDEFGGVELVYSEGYIENFQADFDQFLNWQLNENQFPLDSIHLYKLNFLLSNMREDEPRGKYSISLITVHLTTSTYDSLQILRNKIKSMNQEQLDSLLVEKHNKPGFINRYLLKRGADYNPDDPNAVKELIKSSLISLSYLMFLLVPILALGSFILFRKRKYFYEHLVFSLHIHAAIFLLYTLVFLSFFLFDSSVFIGIILLAILLQLYYFFKASKNFFEERKFIAFFKWFIISLPYIVSLSFLMILAILAGFIIG